MPREDLEASWSRLSRRDFLAASGFFLSGSIFPDGFLRLSGAGSNAAILQEMRRFLTTGSVLYVAAHPDDENNELIAYFARGLNYRTGYLSLTRGDGGQNVIGGEIGADLGAIRTQELLAAARIDGAHQFFTRALDFGFSKDYRKTLTLWDRQQVVADIVRVIRTFRPDVVITRFAPEPSGTHGHHTASAVLAIEAFKLAGDPTFPGEFMDLKPWQPKRILQNGGGGPDSPAIEISGLDPVLGVSYNEVAGRSRGMHQSQFGKSGFVGGRGGGGVRREAFRLLGGEPATKDPFDGIDTTWARVAHGGAEIAALAARLVNEFKDASPEASVPLLLELHGRLDALPPDPLVQEKRQSLDILIQHCLGLVVETTIPDAEVVPGEKLRLRHSVQVSSSYPVRWLGVHYAGVAGGAVVALKRGEEVVREDSPKLASNTPLSQPYWLRHEPTAGMFVVDFSPYIGLPENPPAFPLVYSFSVGGQTISIPTEPIAPSFAPKATRRMEVIAPVSLQPETAVRLFAPGTSKTISVAVAAARPGVKGVLGLDVPAGWSVTPAKKAFDLKSAGDKLDVEFTVKAPARPEAAVIAAHALVNGRSYGVERKIIDYPHIPTLLLQPNATVKAVTLECALAAKNVGYLPGSGDGVAAALTEMGCTVTQLSGADLTDDKLKGFDAVVTGVRAFNVRTDLSEKAGDALAAFAEQGGTVVVQYNRPDGLKGKPFPYRLQLSTLRITDRNSPMSVLAPEHAALNKPNKISQADFDGWVQERGTYFASEWDDHFVPLLASEDAGESPLKGGLLVAAHGKGFFVYTGLTFFRQLPAGVPGAYRLFANLVSLGR
ncbi:MAG TPA: PIG-L family deacetylase [Fimbriimonadaceae bacterium]|nr:PIG-L family deacetylase [Fimbriimonadaceae bacterium]